jgi:hypothetical protein
MLRLNDLHIKCLSHSQQSDVDIGPSFTKYMLENGDHYGLTEDETAFLGGSLFRAGSNTVMYFCCPRTSMWLKLGSDYLSDLYSAHGSCMFPR